MTFDLARVLEERRGENFQLHMEYMNPQLARVLKTLGFDRFYERGEGAYSTTTGAIATSTCSRVSASSPSGAATR